MLENIDLEELRKIPQIAFYFRYPLHRHDFHELRSQGQVRGDYAAKPLYERLTPSKHVDRYSEYNGDIASLFVPQGTNSFDALRLILTHIDRRRILLPSGRRNWPVIRAAAEESILNMLVASSSSQDRIVPLTIR